jgi:hypothetical protein
MECLLNEGDFGGIFNRRGAEKKQREERKGSPRRRGETEESVNCRGKEENAEQGLAKYFDASTSSATGLSNQR